MNIPQLRRAFDRGRQAERDRCRELVYREIRKFAPRVDDRAAEAIDALERAADAIGDAP